MVKYCMTFLLSLVIFTGCGCKQQELETYRQNNPYYTTVEIPVMCEVKDVKCGIVDEDTHVEVVDKLVKCVYHLKKEAKACQ